MTKSELVFLLGRELSLECDIAKATEDWCHEYVADMYNDIISELELTTDKPIIEIIKEYVRYEFMNIENSYAHKYGFEQINSIYMFLLTQGGNDND